MNRKSVVVQILPRMIPLFLVQLWFASRFNIIWTDQTDQFFLKCAGRQVGAVPVRGTRGDSRSQFGLSVH